MPYHARQPTRTALPGSSIWDTTLEAIFRSNVVALERQTNAVPLDCQHFPVSSWDPVSEKSASYQLSLLQEQQLADDLSFIAAVGEGAQSVAAATVQESTHLSNGSSRPSLRFTVASVDAIDESAQSFLNGIFKCLSTVATGNQSAVLQDIFGQIAGHHSQRLLNRLRSVRWTKPTYLARTHKKPLFADFENLKHRAQLLYARSERSQRVNIEARLASLASVLEAFEVAPEGGPAAEAQQRLDLIRACFDFCVSKEVAGFLHRLQKVRATSQIQACLKTLHQVEKIAAYYRIPTTLTDYALKFSGLFGDVELIFLTPYEATPIEVAYQPWAASTHVHAEVMLSVYHDLNGATGAFLTRPRCMGASKYLCYLCYLFIRRHGSYFPSSTHGACYDQWTIPDLAEYPHEMRQRYQGIIHGMNHDVVEAIKSATRRPEPMTSRENLIDAYQAT
ncbi:hypothetical protein EV126DRAFT_116457 [Verticillium dahliae]|nr:hypothetical protein EV126DRAFT_116457 [Verticillium dahliae]